MKKFLLLTSASLVLFSCNKEQGSPDAFITTSTYAGVNSAGDTIYAFYVPNGFTPNADGINEFYYGYGFGIEPLSYTMKIFTRYGEECFFTITDNNGWDGKVNGGKEPSPVGTYNAQFEFSDTLGQHHLIEQRILLVR